MVSLGRILRDYQDAGSVNSLLAPWGFVDETTFLTKAGHVGGIYRLKGVDYEGLTHAQRRTVAHRVEAALRMLDERCRVYQYFIKRTIQPIAATPCAQPIARDAIEARAAFLNGRREDLYEVSAYLVLLYEPPTSAKTSTRLRRLWRSPSQALREWLSPQQTLQILEREVEDAVGTLHHKASAFQVQLGEIGPRRLNKADAFHFFRQLVNFDHSTADAGQLKYDTHVDYFMADSPVECHRDHLTVGNRFVKVLSMKEPPAQTFAHVLAGLYEIPGELVACLEWQRIASDRMRRDLQTRRRHFFNKRVSMVNYLSSDNRPEEMLVDDSASATVRQLGDAVTELEVNGHFFGTCSLTLVLHSEDKPRLQQHVAEAAKAVAVHDGSLFDETYNLLNAWLSTVPGNGAHNVRRLALLETNLADLSFVFTHDPGERVSAHLRKPALAIFETPHHARAPDRLDPAPADPAEAAGCDESPLSYGRSKELLDLHQHPARQRAGRGGVQGVRVRGGTRPPCGICVSWFGGVECLVGGWSVRRWRPRRC